MHSFSQQACLPLHRSPFVYFMFFALIFRLKSNTSDFSSYSTRRAPNGARKNAHGNYPVAPPSRQRNSDETTLKMVHLVKHNSIWLSFLHDADHLIYSMESIKPSIVTWFLHSIFILHLSTSLAELNHSYFHSWLSLARNRVYNAV